MSSCPNASRGIEVLGPAARLAWLGIAAAVVAVEILPVRYPNPWTHAYLVVKGILFVTAGYAIPLTFSRFNSLVQWLTMMVVLAALVEVVQGVIASGHSASVIEAFGKVSLIVIGFGLGLDARYDRAISIGPLHLQLRSEHLSQR